MRRPLRRFIVLAATVALLVAAVAVARRLKRRDDDTSSDDDWPPLQPDGSRREAVLVEGAGTSGAAVLLEGEGHTESTHPEHPGRETAGELTGTSVTDGARSIEAPHSHQLVPTTSSDVEVTPTTDVSATGHEVATPSSGDVAVSEPAWVEPEQGACPASHPVKAKESSQIYHVEGGANYDRTRPDRCYRDEASAEADGFRRSKI